MIMIHQLSTYVYNVEGYINNDWINITVTVTKNGNIRNIKGEGTNKYKQEIIRMLYDRGILNETVLSIVDY